MRFKKFSQFFFLSMLFVIGSQGRTLLLAQERFLPLDVGNRWYYQNYTNVGELPFVAVAEYDTLMPNGSTYTHVSRALDLTPGYLEGSEFLRYDSSGNLYGYMRDGSDQLVVPFTLNVGEKWYTPDSSFYWMVTVSDTNVFESGSREMRHFQGIRTDGGFPGWDYVYAQGLGMLSGATYFFESYPVLLGAIIRGVEYGNVSAIAPSHRTLSQRFLLNIHPNYPNPFNASTSITFSLQRNAEIQIGIFNNLGQSVFGPVVQFKHAGEHKFIWEAAALSSGTYFFKIQTATEQRVLPMVYLK